MIKLGALWTKKSKMSGEEFHSGNITIDGKETKIVVFKNRKQDSENHPDWIIYLSEPKPQDSSKEGSNDGIPF